MLEERGFLQILLPVSHVVGEVETTPYHSALAILSTGQEHLILLCQDRPCPSPQVILLRCGDTPRTPLVGGRVETFYVDVLPNDAIGVNIPGCIQSPFSHPAHRGRRGQLSHRVRRTVSLPEQLAAPFDVAGQELERLLFVPVLVVVKEQGVETLQLLQ